MPASAALVDGPPRSRWDGVCMTLAEFEALPEEKPYLEYFHGRVVQKPVSKRPHGKGQGRLFRRLDDYATEQGGEAWPEASVYFEQVDDVAYLTPDVAYWGSGKHQGDNDRSLAPTLAVEIRSKDQSLSLLFAKCRLMRANGVDVCWLVDPVARNAYIFEGDTDGEPTGEFGVLSSGYLPGFRFALEELWALIA